MVLEDLDYEWHEMPKFMYYTLALSFGIFLMWSPFHFTSIPGVDVLFYVGMFFLAISAIFALLTFPAYYIDGKKIKEAGVSDWEPNIKVYLLTSVLLTPYAVGWVYMIRRNKHIRTLDAGKKMV